MLEFITLYGKRARKFLFGEKSIAIGLCFLVLASGESHSLSKSIITGESGNDIDYFRNTNDDSIFCL